jgi:RNA polymerase sigma factor (sigma-70 family)
VTGPDLLLKHLRRTVVAAPLTGLADDDLLRQFTTGGYDAEAAFEVLVRRHGPMVLRVCRSSLRDVHAADDAFQAAFLVLVKKAPVVPTRGSLGPWLFGVARRVCERARVAAARRARRECGVVSVATASNTGGLDPDIVAIVHAEVGRLPESLRAAIVLCDLAGLTYHEAADRLGLPHATVRGRVARGRTRLQQRLARRGIGPEVLGVTVVTVPGGLAATTARAAMVMNGMATGAVSVPVLELVTGGLTSMVQTKLKAASITAFAGAVLIASALTLGAQIPGPEPTPSNAPAAGAGDFTRRSVAGPVRSRTDDPAEAIARLAQDAKERQAAGDAKGARQILRRLHATVFEWEDVLADKASIPAVASVVPGPAVAATPYGRGISFPEATPLPPVTGPRPTSEPDMEMRMRRLEDKLDKLMKSIETRRSSDQPPR